MQHFVTVQNVSEQKNMSRFNSIIIVETGLTAFPYSQHTALCTG
jgi:hypothetical protein